MVKELTPHTVNNLYRKYFEEVFDFSDATNYGLNRSSSGVVFNALVSITGNRRNRRFYIFKKDLNSLNLNSLIRFKLF